jgi:hypothetical protein
MGQPVPLGPTGWITGVAMGSSARRQLSGWIVSAAAVAVVTGVIELFRGDSPDSAIGVLYLLAALPVAVVWWW